MSRDDSAESLVARRYGPTTAGGNSTGVRRDGKIGVTRAHELGYRLSAPLEAIGRDARRPNGPLNGLHRSAASAETRAGRNARGRAVCVCVCVWMAVDLLTCATMSAALAAGRPLCVVGCCMCVCLIGSRRRDPATLNKQTPGPGRLIHLSRRDDVADRIAEQRMQHIVGAAYKTAADRARAGR